MRLRGLPGLLVLGVVLLFVVPSAAGYYTDWLWFREVGYEQVFLRSLNAQTVVFAATFSAVFLFLSLNLRFARRRTSERPHVVLGTGADGRQISMDGRRLASLATPVALVVALILGFAAATQWLEWLTFFNAVPFGGRDPLLGHEIGFYVYRLPIYQLIREQALTVSILALIGCSVYYLFSGSFVLEARPNVSSWPKVRLVPAARRHLSLLTALILGLMAWGAWLQIAQTLLTPASPAVAFGASYADVYAAIPVQRVTVAVLGLAALLAIWHGFARRGWMLPLALALYIGVSTAGSLYTGFVQRFVVTPNEQDKEQPYIHNNITSTRQAYALDRVEERELLADEELTPADIVDNAGTIENVRLWDHEPLLQTFAQIQEIRMYYDFVSVDNDRYTIDGKYRQVMLSARELNTESMPNQSWNNERLTFTHGYGITLGPVNQVTTEGLPVLFVRDLPPVSTTPDIKLDEPSIYFGEKSNSYVLVRTAQREFHYPRGDDNETTIYNGRGGVPVGSLMRRLLFAIRFASTNILVTNQITAESRILFHRQVLERAQLIAPFLQMDPDPYPVVAGGRLYWIQDAYTTSANYPYSTPARGSDVNYIRNSAKIIIDAYHGSVTFYLADPTDPLVRTVANIFPTLFRPMSDMPKELAQHVRYPEELFRVQSQIFATYHMTNPVVFYNKEDQWQVPVLDSGQSSNEMKPYYTIMKLPGETKTEFIQMLPFTPRAKDNLSAWMIARSDGAHYGRLEVFQFPKQSLVYGPRQIIGRINQDQDISPQISLWNQQGSEVRWGTLLVIPIKESLIYVRPLYLRSAETKIPELKRVVVATASSQSPTATTYQNRIVMADTLTDGLVQIFGRSVASGLAPDRLASSATSIVQTPADTVPAATLPETPASADSTLRQLIDEANLHFERGLAALKENDFATYGEEMNKAHELLKRMQTAK